MSNTSPTQATTVLGTNGERMDTYIWCDGRLVVSDRTLDWRDGEALDKTLKRGGFSKYPSIELGDEYDAVSVRVYGRQNETSTDWLADLCVADCSHFVWLDDVNELLDFVRHFAQTFAAAVYLADRANRLRV